MTDIPSHCSRLQRCSLCVRGPTDNEYITRPCPINSAQGANIKNTEQQKASPSSCINSRHDRVKLHGVAETSTRMETQRTTRQTDRFVVDTTGDESIRNVVDDQRRTFVTTIKAPTTLSDTFQPGCSATSCSWRLEEPQGRVTLSE